MTPGSPQVIGEASRTLTVDGVVIEVGVVAVGRPDVLLISQRQVHPVEQLGRLVHRRARVQTGQRRHRGGDDNGHNRANDEMTTLVRLVSEVSLGPIEEG